HCERDCRTGSAERLRCLETDAGSPTCYDGALSAQIDAFNHLSRGRTKSKVRYDPLHESISLFASVRAKLKASDALTLGLDRLDPIANACMNSCRNRRDLMFIPMRSLES